MRVAGSSRKPRNPAAAAKPEDRQPIDRSRQIEPVHQFRIETRYGKAGNGIDDDGADILELDAGGTDRAFCHLLEQVERMVQEDFGPLFPAMLLLVPFGRLASVTRLDPGIAKEALIVGKLGKRRLARRAASACKSLFAGDRRGDTRDLNVKARLEATGLTDRTRSFEHDEFPRGKGSFAVASLDLQATREPAVAPPQDLNSSCELKQNRGNRRLPLSYAVPSASSEEGNPDCQCGL